MATRFCTVRTTGLASSARCAAGTIKRPEHFRSRQLSERRVAIEVVESAECASSFGRMSVERLRPQQSPSRAIGTIRQRSATSNDVSPGG